MQGARRGPWWALRPSRATPQTPLTKPTLRDRADFASSVVVASSLGVDPTSSAPPRLKRNLPRSRPRGLLRQAPRLAAPCRGNSVPRRLFSYHCRPVGAWRSLVAHLHGVQGVASSNLVAPTN